MSISYLAPVLAVTFLNAGVCGRTIALTRVVFAFILRLQQQQAAAAPPAQTADPAGYEAYFDKYRKMIKMGLPEGSIRNKATQDGCTDEVMDYFFKNCTGGGGGAAPSPAPAPAPTPAPAPAPPPAQVPKSSKRRKEGC